MKRQWPLFVLAIVLACTTDKEIDVSPENGVEAPTLSDGRLKFTSSDNIATFISSFTRKSDAEAVLGEISEFNSKLNFKSFFDRSNTRNANARSEGETVVDDINVSIDPIADSVRLSDLIDPRLASIVDEKKELEINDGTIVRFQNDYTFLYKKGNQALLKEFYQDLKENKVTPPSGSAGIEYKGVQIYKTHVTIYGLSGPKTAGRVMETEYACDVRSYDDWWRVTGRAYTHYSWVYTSAGIEAHSQTKRRKCKTLGGCWYSWDVDVNVPNFNLRYDIYVAINATVGRWQETQLLNNTSVATRFFGEISGYNVPEMHLSGWYCTNAYNPSYGVLSCNSTFNISSTLPYSPLSCP